MSLSRGRFLKSLGSSLAGAATGAGVVQAARALVDQIAPGQAAPPASFPNRPSSTIPFLNRGSGQDGQIALTFDDGPTPGVTELVLDELKRRHLIATFFMIGRKVMAAPDLARRVLAEGHEVGNHTFHHLKLSSMSDQQAGEEIDRVQETMQDLLGHRPAWLRPPYGAFRRDQGPLAAARGLRVVLGDVDSRDWAQPGAAKIVERVLARTRPGSIILCHDIHSQTAEALGGMLDGLLARGLRFAGISALTEATASRIT